MPLRKSTGSVASKDAALRGELEHQGVSKKVRTTPSQRELRLGRVNPQPCAIGRWSSISVPEVGTRPDGVRRALPQSPGRWRAPQ